MHAQYVNYESLNRRLTCNSHKNHMIDEISFCMKIKTGAKGLVISIVHNVLKSPIGPSVFHTD